VKSTTMWHRLAETNVQNYYRQMTDRIISRMLQTTDTPGSRDLSPMIVNEQRITLVNIIHNNDDDDDSQTERHEIHRTKRTHSRVNENKAIFLSVN